MKSAIQSIIPSRSTDRWIAGVAGGIGRRLGIEPIYVRAGFVAFGLLGFVSYVLLLMLTIDSVEADERPPTEASGDRKFSLLLLFGGSLLLAREVGLVPDVMLPVALVLFGAAALWDRSTPARRSRLTRLLVPDITGGPTLGRTLGGIALLAVGLIVLLPGIDVVRRAGWVAVGAVVAAAGAALVFGPWLYRLGSELRAERSQRLRADARAEVAAHLHDSVLQTLALIQRAADDPRKMVTLARSQERELRNWLFQGSTGQDSDLEPALWRAAAKVEREHDVPINVIVVGQADIDARIEALIGAAREAMVNAAKHSGAEFITVYAEVSPDRVDAWITDQGTGFDPELVAAGSAGIRGSIVERMERHGGHATISSSADGTEVHLELPLKEPAR